MRDKDCNIPLYSIFAELFYQWHSCSEQRTGIDHLKFLGENILLVVVEVIIVLHKFKIKYVQILGYSMIKT